jgi:hypothetical protein
MYTILYHIYTKQDKSDIFLPKRGKLLILIAPVVVMLSGTNIVSSYTLDVVASSNSPANEHISEQGRSHMSDQAKEKADVCGAPFRCPVTQG